MAGFLEMTALSKVYDTPSGPLPVVEDFDLEAKKGEFIALIGHSGCGKSTVLQIVEYDLAVVGLADSMDKFPSELSRGMRQRVGIARAFALQPRMLLLDEAFGMLDSLTRIELQDVLIDIWSEDRMTALMVTHDVDEALFLADRVVMMTSGPRARVGQILEVPFGRPRDRLEVLEDPDYYKLRGQLISFLEDEDRDEQVVKAA